MTTKSLTPLVVRSLRIEFETTTITEDQLRIKYQLPDGVPDMSSWTKGGKVVEATEIITSTPPTIPAPPTEDPEDDQQVDKIGKLSEDILTFKQLAMDKALGFMRDVDDYTEVKDFKDVVSVVSSIENSIRDQRPQGPTVNVFIQNLLQNFRDDV